MRDISKYRIRERAYILILTKNWILLEEPNGSKCLTFRSRERWLANKLLVNQQVDASSFVTDYKVRDSSKQQGIT